MLYFRFQECFRDAGAPVLQFKISGTPLQAIPEHFFRNFQYRQRIGEKIGGRHIPHGH